MQCSMPSRVALELRTPNHDFQTFFHLCVVPLYNLRAEKNPSGDSHPETYIDCTCVHMFMCVRARV